jgi:hypothetical protein
LDGKGETIIPIPKISAVQEMVALEDGSLLFRDQSYTDRLRGSIAQTTKMSL